MSDERLPTWDIDDDDVKTEDNMKMTFDSKTGLYKRIVTREDEEGEIYKELIEYKMITCHVSEAVKQRRKWKKFGGAKDEPTGPNPAHTYLGEEVIMVFKTDDVVAPEEEPKAKDQSVKCRNCGGEHFSHKCPYKEEIENIQILTAEIENFKPSDKPEQKNKVDIPLPKTGAYVPPHLSRGVEDKKRSDPSNTIRVSNLPESARETDLEDLFRPFGGLSRTFLARDKVTGISRGFAYITFNYKADASKAIEAVNGYGYEHCILQVEWAKPQ